MDRNREIELGQCVFFGVKMGFPTGEGYGAQLARQFCLCEGMNSALWGKEWNFKQIMSFQWKKCEWRVKGIPGLGRGGLESMMLTLDSLEERDAGFFCVGCVERCKEFLRDGDHELAFPYLVGLFVCCRCHVDAECLCGLGTDVLLVQVKRSSYRFEGCYFSTCAIDQQLWVL